MELGASRRKHTSRWRFVRRGFLTSVDRQSLNKSTDVLNTPHAGPTNFNRPRCALCGDPGIPRGWTHWDEPGQSSTPIPDDVANSEKSGFWQCSPRYCHMLSHGRDFPKGRNGYRLRVKFSNHGVHSGAGKATREFVKSILSGGRAEVWLPHTFNRGGSSPAFWIARHRDRRCAIGRKGR